MEQLTRRQFAGAVAAGLAASSALATSSVRGQVAPNDRIRLGVIGYGSRAAGNLAEFLRNPEVECAVICDVDEAHLAKGVAHCESQRGNRPDAVNDFRRVVERNDIDAVLVSTPDHWHALPTVYACQTGKDVYVEKPLARTIDEGRAIVEAARENKRVVQMGTQWHSAPHFREAAEYVRSGKLGALRLVRAWSYKNWRVEPASDSAPPEGVDYNLWLGPSPERPFNINRFHGNFRWFWDYAGGLMTDLGVHVLNICQWCTGLSAPLRVSSTGASPAYGGRIETPDTQVAVYEFPEYTLLWEHQLQGRIGPRSATDGAWFSGTRGTLVVTRAGWEVIPEPSAGNTLEPEEHGPSPDDGRPAHVRDFLDCMLSRNQPASNPEAGHHVTTIAHLGNIAWRTGAEVAWDAQAERITNNPDADALVGEPYRAPWELPYSRRG